MDDVPAAVGWIAAVVGLAAFSEDLSKPGDLVLASTAVSAAWRSLIAVVTAASAGAEFGKAGLPVIALTMPCAYVTSADTFLDERFSDAIDLRIVLVVMAMESDLFVE